MPETPIMNTLWTLAARPQGMVKQSDFALQTYPLQSLQDGEFRVQIQYISLDPAIRGWMNAGTTYVSGIELGAVIRTFSAGTVVETRNGNFPVGTAVTGLFGAQRFAVSQGKNVDVVDASQAPLHLYLGALGMPGMTAYFGLLDKGKPQAGETVVVSGAAGIVGSLVGQIAKLKGCRTIGIAGGVEKCAMLTQDFGFDAAIDYKSEKVLERLKIMAPDGVHIYFDNVGGEILDAALANLARGARVVLCGAISQYNATAPNGPKNYLKIVTARGIMHGIIVFDYQSRYPEAVRDIAEWMREGHIVTYNHIIEGLEQFPDALLMLFSGENRGKLLIQCS
jgi:NADPH-dependent curcumin reductase CurA